MIKKKNPAISWLLFLWNCIFVDLREYGISSLCFNLTDHSSPQPYTVCTLSQHSLAPILHTTDAIPDEFTSTVQIHAVTLHRLFKEHTGKLKTNNTTIFAVKCNNLCDSNNDKKHGNCYHFDANFYSHLLWKGAKGTL